MKRESTVNLMEPRCSKRMDGLCSSEEISESESEDNRDKSTPWRRRFSAPQQAKLISLYHSGMRGVGRQYDHCIQNAATDTGLTSEQVKVSHALFNREWDTTNNIVFVLFFVLVM